MLGCYMMVVRLFALLWGAAGLAERLDARGFDAAGVAAPAVGVDPGLVADAALEEGEVALL